MRDRCSLSRCGMAVAAIVVIPSIVTAQSSAEQGRKILSGVQATYLMIDFGIEALEPQQFRDLCFAHKLLPADGQSGLGDDEWSIRRGLLDVERLGRDLVAGKPIPAEAEKILRASRETADDGPDGSGAYRRQLDASAERQIAGRPLTEVEFSIIRARCDTFRSGDQLYWETVTDLTFDVARLAKAYSQAPAKSQHAIRILLGHRGKSDELAVEMTLRAMRGATPIERYDAALTAGRLQPPSQRLVAALIDRLDDRDPRVVRAASQSLVALNATQSAPAMLRRLRQALDDQRMAELEDKLRYKFEEYGILDSFVGFRYDVPSELMFGLGRFRHVEALPLLWEVVQGKAADLKFDGIYELGHGGVAFETIAAIEPETATVNARRVLQMKESTTDALGAAANVLGQGGQNGDIPALTAVMLRFDASARRKPRFYFQASGSMARVTFAAERLLYFADPTEPGFSEAQAKLIAGLRSCASGPFGTSIMAALADFDPDHVDDTALAVAADRAADPNARRVAIEILERTNQPQHVELLIDLFEDDGNATNGTVGEHAAWATAKLLGQADGTDPLVAKLVKRAADRLEELVVRNLGYRMLSISDRGVRRCTELALDGRVDDLKRSIALDYIARYARPNRELAAPLAPLLDKEMEDSQATAGLQSAAANAMAKLLGMAPSGKNADVMTLVERVRRELQGKRGN